MTCHVASPQSPTDRAAEAPAKRRRADPLVDAWLGERIRRLRRRRGVSQQALAERLGVSFQQVQKYENGRNRVSAATLHRLAGALGAPVGWFFDGLPAAGGAATEASAGPEALGEAMLSAAHGPALAQAFLRLPPGRARRALAAFAAELAEAIGAEER